MRVLLEAVPIAFFALRTNLVRSLLTVLGIIIGVAAVVGVVSIVQGLQHLFTEQMQGVGATYVLVLPNQTADQEHNRRIEMGWDDGQAILQEAEDITAISPLWQRNERVASGTSSWDTKVIASSPGYQDINNHFVDRGRFVSERDMRTYQKVVVLGRKVVDELELGPKPIGERITLADVPFVVVGVMEEKGQTLGDNQDDLAIIPFHTAERLFGEQDVMMFAMKASRADRVELAKEQIDRVMRRRHPVEEGREPTWRVMLQSEILDSITSVLGAFTGVMAGVVGFSLLVGGIGIMNIMLVSVTERTREIGVRKALGATRRMIASQFLIEALVLSVAGGLLGVVVGWLFGVGGTAAIRHFLIDSYPPAYVPMWAVGLSFAFCTIIGVVFGIYPATKAAALDPIDALRYG
jgi:putative ABC transport system permease protein